MAISGADLERIAEAVGELDESVNNPAAVLRGRFPGLVFVHLDCTDVEGEPARSTACFDLHLIDTSAHCVRLVCDPAEATGVVLAPRTARSR